jgi:ParB-like chromosome segregation protein Spo0J
LANWQNRITGHGEESPDDLLANPLNWRIHPQAQQDALSTVLDSVGLVQSVVVNQRSGFVVDGHLRISLALRTGQTAVPVTYVDLTDDEERLILATLDPIGAMAAPDHEKLADVLESIASEEARVNDLVRIVGQENGAIPPEFGSIPEEDVRRLDQRKPIVCPECGHEFTA